MLQKFHEQIGLKFDAAMDGDTTSEGWRNMLGVYAYQPLRRAVNDATQGLTWKELYSDPAAKAKWEDQVNRLLPVYIKQGHQLLLKIVG